MIFHDSVLAKLEQEVGTSLSVVGRKEQMYHFQKVVSSSIELKDENLSYMEEQYNRYKESYLKCLRFNPNEQTSWNESTYCKFLIHPQIYMHVHISAVAAPLEAVYIFFDTATYNEIERDVKVKAKKILTFGLMQKWIHAGDNRGPIGSHWRHNGPPHGLLHPKRGRDHLLRGQVLLGPQAFQGQSGGCC